MAEREVKSNSTVEQLKIYAGIGAAGLLTGAAITASRSPIYDDEKRARGVRVPVRKMPFDKAYTKSFLDPIDQDAYDMHLNQNNITEAYRLEQKARRNFHSYNYEWQQKFVEGFHNPGKAEGSIIRRMLNGLRRSTKL